MTRFLVFVDRAREIRAAIVDISRIAGEVLLFVVFVVVAVLLLTGACR
jgi:hypothetical protein